MCGYNSYTGVCVLTLPLARRTDDGLPLAVPFDVFLVTSGGRRGRFPARGLLEEGWRMGKCGRRKTKQGRMGVGCGVWWKSKKKEWEGVKAL